MAASCSSCWSTLPAVCPLHDNTKRTTNQDPTHPHLPAEPPQRLELPHKHTENSLSLCWPTCKHSMVLTDEELMRFQGESTENRAQISICGVRCNSCRVIRTKCFLLFHTDLFITISFHDIPSCSIYCSAACPISFRRNNLLKILFPSDARSLHTELWGQKCCWRAFQHFQHDHACVLKWTGSICKKVNFRAPR